MPPEFRDAFGAVMVVGTIGGFITLWRWMSIRSRKFASAQPTEAFQAVEQRLARVEVALDDMSVALNRLTEGQQFLTRLLSERAHQA